MNVVRRRTVVVWDTGRGRRGDDGDEACKETGETGNGSLVKERRWWPCVKLMRVPGESAASRSHRR